MEHTRISKILTVLFAAVFCFGPVGQAEPLGTAFTYQGRLIDANEAADGLYDFQFKLFDANSSGNKLGADVNKPEVDVIDGYFTAELDFGGVFDGNNRWLDIGVRPGVQNDPNLYTTLSSRQKVTPAPYALYAGTAGSGVSLWQVNGTSIYYNNGNVGIGTMSPEKKLDIASEDYTDLGICLTNKSQGGTSWDIDNDGGVFKIVEHASCGPEFLNSTRIAVVGNCIGSPYGGNVGIGTTNPNATLDVNGTINTSSVYQIGVSTVLSVAGTGNTFVGLDAGAVNTGFGNTFSGYQAGYSNTTGYQNTFSGVSAGYSNTKGFGNTFSGTGAGYYNTEGNYNIFSGYVAGISNTTGSFNTFSGMYAGFSNTTGSFNTFSGNWAGYSNTTGSGNVFLGNWAGYSEAGSNKLCIANSSADANVLIYGDFSTGRIGIRTKNPQGTLDVNGPIYQRGGLLHADYVFKPGYKLESIEQHSESMWQNRHLPAIPKAQVNDDGQEIIEVGAHQRGIVEELEKAHIYIEQLNKEIVTLKSEKDTKIESLSKANEDIKARLSAMESLVAKLSLQKEGGIK